MSEFYNLISIVMQRYVTSRFLRKSSLRLVFDHCLYFTHPRSFEERFRGDCDVLTRVPHIYIRNLLFRIGV